MFESKTATAVNLLLAAALLLPGVFCFAQNQTANVDSYVESLRSDLRADKVAIITQAMKFNDHDSKVFWPVYRKYEADLMKVNDIRVNALKMYADKYDTMTDADAKSLIDQSLKYQTERTEVKKKYAKEFQKAGLSSLTVAKFMQLEYRLDLLLDLEIAASNSSLLEKN